MHTDACMPQRTHQKNCIAGMRTPQKQPHRPRKSCPSAAWCHTAAKQEQGLQNSEMGWLKSEERVAPPKK